VRALAVGLLGLLAFAGAAQAQTFTIDRAEWQNSDGGRLRVEGNGQDGRTVTIRNAGNNVVLGTDTIEDDSWERRFRNLTQVPCRVRASDGVTTRERDVSNRPANCGPVVGAAPTLSVANVSQNEGNSGTANMSFTVRLSAATTTAVSFSFATGGGTATAGTTGTADYVATSGTGSIAAGATTFTIQVPIRGDTTVEPNETFNLNITGITNAANTTASATGTIVNDDQAAVLPTLSIGNQSANEGNTGTSTMTFTVQLSAAAPTGGVSFNFATANGTATAGSDYVAIPSTARTIAAGQTSTTIAVTLNGDTAVEANETFSVNITGATNTANATASATGTIVNDDQAAGDAQAPTAPANLTATATGGSQVNLSWTAATDNVGVTANRIERCTGTTCTNFAEIASVGNVTTFSNTGLTSNTTYRYRVRAADAAGNLSAYSNIANATTTGGAVGRPNVSINSTSVSRTTIPGGSVGQQPAPVNNNSNAPAAGTGLNTFQVLAVNDLGMHCGDLDTRVSSILPPFNVLHVVALQKGTTAAPRPVKLTEAQVEIRYSAAANATDPILSNTNAVLDPNFAGVYKTNFWDIARTAYAPFYPAGFLATQPLTVDIGLPVPDVETFYLTSPGTLAVDQQHMPGITAPYSTSNTAGNVPQAFTQHVGTQPFFTSFPFGYTSNVNWFEAAGIPIATFDDAGRENAYPLMRVQAVARTAIGAAAAGTVLATVDTVIPVSGEADCKACHAHSADGGNGSGIGRLGPNVTVSIEDPQATSLPLPVSVEWATDKNILRLHDVKHATNLEASSPVVCQTCHYTPALDLAQFGPDTPAEQSHKSMSAVMHKSHGDLKNNGFPNLFPDMPGPVGRNATQAQDVLNNTCYMCHPGRRVQCMRGAMGQAGVVCQDCHGNMTQVGTDFSRNKPAGNFELAGDFYTNPNTPRVPWANEPGCGSCHTGDAVTNGRPAAPAGQSYVVSAAPDGIRLLQAYRTGDAKATPVVPTNKRFAEDTTASGNPKLYRVSVGGAAATGGGASGHGGLFCEACHGSTHAEWASQPTVTLANANDNKTPQQIQGHNGLIIECRACHGTAYDGNTGNTVGNAGSGPHGMHPVGNDTNVTTGTAAGPAVSFVDGGHRNGINRNLCRTCHGATGQGTVLSETKAPRQLNGTLRPAGFRVTCSVCHGNEL
jgi:hypothetical protein